MNWILGLIGAVFGAAMAGERGLFGAVAGFLLVYLLGALVALKNRLQRNESDLNVLRLRVAELSARATVSAAAAGAQTEAADTADFPQPKPPPGDLLQAVAFRELRSEHEAALAEQTRTSTDRASEEFIQASPAIDAIVQPVASTTTESAQPRRASPTPREPPAPGWDDKITAAIKRWFTEGNVPVKIGVLVLFAGVAAALRYAAVQGYFTMPIEVRLATTCWTA